MVAASDSTLKQLNTCGVSNTCTLNLGYVTIVIIFRVELLKWRWYKPRNHILTHVPVEASLMKLVEIRGRVYSELVVLCVSTLVREILQVDPQCVNFVRSCR